MQSRETRVNERPRTDLMRGVPKIRLDPIYLRVALLALAEALVEAAWAPFEGWQGAQ